MKRPSISGDLPRRRLASEELGRSPKALATAEHRARVAALDTSKEPTPPKG